MLPHINLKEVGCFKDVCLMLDLLERKSDTQLLSRPGVKVEHHVVLVLLPPVTQIVIGEKMKKKWQIKDRRSPLHSLDLVVDIVDEAFNFREPRLPT